MLKTQIEHTTKFMDTLAMSIEKMSQDIYRDGKVGSKIAYIEKEVDTMKNRFKQIEIYTGLSLENNAMDDISSSSPLKEKDFI